MAWLYVLAIVAVGLAVLIVTFVRPPQTKAPLAKRTPKLSSSLRAQARLACIEELAHR
jgi:hypothetical protein